MAWTLEIDDLRNSSNVRERKIRKIVRIPKKLNVMNVLRSRFVKCGPAEGGTETFRSLYLNRVGSRAAPRKAHLAGACLPPLSRLIKSRDPGIPSDARIAAGAA